MQKRVDKEESAERNLQVIELLQINAENEASIHALRQQIKFSDALRQQNEASIHALAADNLSLRTDNQSLRIKVLDQRRSKPRH